MGFKGPREVGGTPSVNEAPGPVGRYLGAAFPLTEARRSWS
jgi:hypothetical protein